MSLTSAVTIPRIFSIIRFPFLAAQHRPVNNKVNSDRQGGSLPPVRRDKPQKNTKPVCIDCRRIVNHAAGTWQTERFAFWGRTTVAFPQPPWISAVTRQDAYADRRPSGSCYG
jgi:hypothetical protein